MGKVKQKINKLGDYTVKKVIKHPFLTFLVLILTMFGTNYVSHAYFTANVQGSGKQITISTSDAIVHFTDNNEINETGITPGTTITKTFYVTNTASGSLQYKINWEYLINNFTYRSALKYTITSTGGGGSLSSTQVPDSEDHINIINNITIPGNTTQNYTMTITYEDNGQNQDADKNKSLIGKLEVTDIEGNSILPETSTGTYNSTITGERNLYGLSVSDLMKEIYPIGSIYISHSSKNPSELFPGTTWERYGQGKTLVGLDESDTSFNTVGKTGGTKDAVIPYHRHELNGTNAKADSNGAHTHDVSGSTTTNGAHTHTIAANGITVSSTAQTISTAAPNEVTGEYEDGVNYGEHTHSVSATGKNTNTYTITSSGAHTHTTTAKNSQTTGAGGSHNHSIPALTIAENTSGYTTSTLTTDRSATKTLTGTALNFGVQSSTVGVNTYGDMLSKHTSTSTETIGWAVNQKNYNPITTSYTDGFRIDVTHNHGVTIPQHTTTASTTGNESSHTHSFNIPALDIASSGAHTHSIPANAISVSVTGSTSSDNHAGAHIHDINLPSLTSKNASAITVPNTNSGHSHTVTGTAASAGAHEHTLSGYSAYVGTSGNATNANLQPYITVYMWKRVS